VRVDPDRELHDAEHYLQGVDPRRCDIAEHDRTDVAVKVEIHSFQGLLLQLS